MALSISSFGFITGGGRGSRKVSHLLSDVCMIPPSAADGCSGDERESGDNTEDERRRLPSAREPLLLDGEAMLSVQPLFFLGELLLCGNSPLSLLGGVAKQCVCLWGVHDEEREHRRDDENEVFHGWKTKRDRNHSGLTWRLRFTSVRLANSRQDVIPTMSP